MKDMQEIKNKVSILYRENLILKSLNNEKDRIIEELMFKIEKLEEDIEYSKVNGGIKKLVLVNKN